MTARDRGPAAARTAVGAVVLVAALAAGCTGDSPAEEPAPDADGTAAGASPDGGDGRGDGPTAEELSAQILADAEAAGTTPPVATVTAEAAGDTFTLDVVGVRRTAGATAAELRLSAADGPTGIGVVRFNEGRFDSPSFVRGIALQDREPDGSGTRYYPWAFEDHRQACVCPVLPLELDDRPVTVYALYPPLPAGVDTVDVTLTEELTVPDVPVTGVDADEATAAETG